MFNCLVAVRVGVCRLGFGENMSPIWDEISFTLILTSSKIFEFSSKSFLASGELSLEMSQFLAAGCNELEKQNKKLF